MKQALLVIDVQKIYTLEDTGYLVEDLEPIVSNINRLIDKFYKQGDLIIYIKHEHAPDGIDSGRMFDFDGESGEIEFKKGTVDIEFIDNLNIIPNAIIISKTRYDAFINTVLEEELKKNNIDKIVICGFMTNFCCESTARHAHDIDYYVDFIKDATGTPGTEVLSPQETINASLATLESGFANVLQTDDVM